MRVQIPLQSIESICGVAVRVEPPVRVLVNGVSTGFWAEFDGLHFEVPVPLDIEDSAAPNVPEPPAFVVERLSKTEIRLSGFDFHRP